MLYIVATPIGNLEDISLRQARTLASCPVILAEDTRSAMTLLEAMKRNFSLQMPESQRIISYYREKEFEKLPEVLNILKDEIDVALISESGMPVVSDPGSLLLQACVRENIPYTVIPGPSAVTTAVVMSGMSSAAFTYLGFVPKRPTEVLKTFQNALENGKIWKDTVFVLFESPKRIQRTLEHLCEVDPRAQVAVCRELTKKFEEVKRGTPAELAKHEYRGEITIVVKFTSDK